MATRDEAQKMLTHHLTTGELLDAMQFSPAMRFYYWLA